MEDFADRYGSRFVKLVDSMGSGKEFEFDQVLLMPTAAGYRALVEQAQVEIKPRIMIYLSRRWSQGAIENLSFFAMAVAVYARRDISQPEKPQAAMMPQACTRPWTSRSIREQTSSRRHRAEHFATCRNANKIDWMAWERRSDGAEGQSLNGNCPSTSRHLNHS